MNDIQQALLNAIGANVRGSGWHCQYVFPREGEAGSSFTYTVGFRERGWPELIIFAVPAKVGHNLLSNARKLFEESGPPPNGWSTDNIANMPTYFREVDPEAACANHLCFARSYYGQTLPERVMQVIWPDREGLFPWEADADMQLHRRQCELVDWRERPMP